MKSKVNPKPALSSVEGLKIKDIKGLGFGFGILDLPFDSIHSLRVVSLLNHFEI